MTVRGSPDAECAMTITTRFCLVLRPNYAHISHFDVLLRGMSQNGGSVREIQKFGGREATRGVLQMDDEPDSPQDHDGNWYVLVAGLLRPENALTLAPGISLRPLQQAPSVFDLAAAGAVGFRHWAVLEPVASACTVELESTKDGAVFPGYDTLHRAWLASALLVLRGYTRHVCVACSEYPWDTIAGHQQRTAGIFKEQLRAEGPEAALHNSRRSLPSFHGNLLDFHLSLLSNQDARTEPVTSDDAAWISEHFEVFSRLAAQSQSFRLALEAAIDWRYAKEPRSAVARLWSGIEAIFGVTSELVYRISLLSACLLTDRGDKRRQKFDEIKKLYGLRSKVVHGEPLSEDKVESALNDSYHLLCDLLQLTISRGHVLGQADFDSAVFG